MQAVEADVLGTFMPLFMKAREAGMLVAQNRYQLARVHAELSTTHLSFASSWQGTLRNLALDVPVAALLSAPIGREFFEIVHQYQHRSGMIQIIDNHSLELTTVHCNPGKARLLLVVESSELEKIEEYTPLQEEISLTRRL